MIPLRFLPPFTPLALRCQYLAPLLIWLLLQASPAFSDPILDKALKFLKEGRADAASAIYHQYLKQHPTSLTAQLALAEIAMRRFDYPLARSILERALAQHPDSPETAAMLGRLFHLWSKSPVGHVKDNTRDYAALAREHFRQAEGMGPKSPLVLSYLAEWQLEQDDLIAAERNLEKALQISPTFIPAFQGQTRLYMKVRDLKRGKDAALQALELDPGNMETYFLTAQLLAMASHPEKAVQYAEKSEQLDYGKLPARDAFLAAQYERLGQLEKATRYYETLVVYTPRDAASWMKLGELYEALNRPEKSREAYRTAMTLNPTLLGQLLAQARDSTRNEKVDVALGQWRRVLGLQPDKPDIVDEALSGLASMHYLYAFYHDGQAHPQARRDLEYIVREIEENPGSDLARLSEAKLQLALHRDESPGRQILIVLQNSADAGIAGEAAFLLEEYGASRDRLEGVDGLSAQGYAALADRLLSIQELQFSKVFYQRAYELEPSPSLEASMKRIQSKQTLATQRVNEGNALYNAKDYQGALEKYREASRIYRQWDNAYLRMGDTYEKLKQWGDAKRAYDTAIAMSPGLLDSQGFSKHYAKLKKKAKA